jgi:ER lumen protein retaining receptor
MLYLFRLAGDMCHVLSFFVLIQRLRTSQSANGLSIKTQVLHLLVFVTRYLDLFTVYYNLYNSGMKTMYITLTACTIYMVKRTEPFKSTFDEEHDSFPIIRYAVAPCFVLALVTSFIQGFNIMEVNDVTWVHLSN